MSGVNTNYNLDWKSADSKTTTKKDIVDKDVFLRILTVELTHQDPMNPKDNTEYISQLAQFTSLEQTQNLSNTINKLLNSQRLTEGATLIGSQVEFNLGNNNFATDIVKSVRVEGSEVYLITKNNGKYKIDQVSEVKLPEVITNDKGHDEQENIAVASQDGEQSQAGEVEIDQQDSELL
jgi:flagellar basal-body rod modification protein FlgD